MKWLVLIPIFLIGTANAAQEIQQSSIDFLLSRPETLDVLMHAETWRFTSTTDNNTYTAIRYISVGADGTRTRYCLIMSEGTFTFPVIHIDYWNFVYFQTNGRNIDEAMKKWCIR